MMYDETIKEYMNCTKVSKVHVEVLNKTTGPNKTFEGVILGFEKR